MTSDRATTDDTAEGDTREPVQTARLWQGDGWTARVIKNQDDDGWAVEMLMDGQREPALVAPWTMGRDKKNPKPLDPAAFYTWVKTASEVVRRHEQQLHALLHKRVKLAVDGEGIEVTLDITPDDDAPYATLTARDRFDDELARVTVDAGFKLNDRTAESWVRDGYKAPQRAATD
jgi:hypothetical protein